MIGLALKENVTTFVRNVQGRLPKALERGVLDAAVETAGAIRSEVYSTFRGRTGGLARSYRETFFGWKGDTVSAGAISDLEYADIQDRGGTIRPRTTKNLAVPIFGGKSLPVGKGPRHFSKGELQLIVRKNGRPLLARVKKRRGKDGIEPLFVLVKSVTLRGREYLEAARKKAEPQIEATLGKVVATTVAKAEQEAGK